MEAAFWHERWEKGEIGFHQHEFNRYMQDFMDRLEIARGARILVPLCGKSRDMLWLVSRGFRVTGIEISERAVQDFYVENGMDYELEQQEKAVVYSSGDIQIFCADFFKVEKSGLPRIDAVYDRASLVALPPRMRTAYARHFNGLIDPDIRSLLVTLDYPQEEMRGPPFSVTPAEVGQLFGAWFDIGHLHSEDCLAAEPRFRKKGLTRMEEHVYILQKNSLPESA